MVEIYDSKFKIEPPENALKFIEWLEKLLKKEVPIKSMDVVELWYYTDGNENIFLSIRYYRDETEGEKFERQVKETVKDRKDKEYRHKTYDRLKKEFGNE